jgi:beta-lactamase class C
MRLDTIFPAASITKLFTATAIMLLVEDGRLALDEPVRTFVPEFLRPGKGAVTVRQVLSHTGGLANELGTDGGLVYPNLDRLDEIRRAMAAAPLASPPGTDLRYSNVGYGVLSLVLEAISGQPHDRFITERVFQPLGMTETRFAPPQPWYARIATVHDTDDPGSDWEPYNSPYFRNLCLPWAGAYTTGRDLLTFLHTFLDSAPGPRLLSPAGIRLMTRSATQEIIDRPEALAWGLGFEIKGNRRPHATGDLSSPATFGHVGSSGTLLYADPAQQMAYTVCFNRYIGQGTVWPHMGRLSNALFASIL